MKETVLQYKCRKCGNIDESLCGGEHIIRQRYTEAIINGKSYSGNDFTVSMTDRHICKDGSDGVTDLIGYRVVEIEE